MVGGRSFEKGDCVDEYCCWSRGAASISKSQRIFQRQSFSRNLFPTQ